MNPSDYEAVSQATTPQELRSALFSFAERMDFPLVNALLVQGELDSPELRIGAVGNTPPEFVMTHADMARFKADPVINRLMAAPIPFIWDQAFYTQANKGHLWEAAAPFGYRVGVAASLPMGPGQRLFVGVDRHDKLPTSGKLLARMQADLQLLAVHAHVAARRVLVLPPPAATVSMELPRLTAREIDVLRWTHAGKTAEVVAQILGIKVTTVNSYIKLAMQKLDVVGSKYKAVEAARALGLF
ncbi:DNA-binding CsgD family transcriptional regulator [Roseateles asaccharophilus]|uniref:helix-turn-helix transcriptional regulator n=1 Tax=Roseateles asaccharophilus TaxID=582607 RepID=UPI003832DB6B